MTGPALRIALLVALLAAVAPDCRAQRYPMRGYTETGGLPSSSVFAVTQDASGCMWFATRAGVARYDGFNWTTHEAPRGMLRAHDTAFHRWDDRTRLWAVADRFPAAVVRFDGEAWGTIEGPRGVESGMRVVAFEVGRYGAGVVLALADAAGRVFVYDEEQGAWSRRREGIDAVQSLAVADDRLYIGTGTGLESVALDGPPQAPRRLATVERGVWAVGPAVAADALWLAGEDWIGRFDGQALERLAEGLPLHDSTGPGRTVLEPDRRGGVYFGNWSIVYHVGERGGLIPLEIDNGLLGDGTTDIHVDREGNAWIAATRGVSKIVGLRLATWRYEHGLLENEVSAVIERRSGEVVLGHPRGLTFFGETMRTLEFAPRDTRTRVLDLAEDGRGRLWVAVEGFGVGEYDGKTIRWRDDAPGSGRSVLVDTERRLWAATTEGVFVSHGGWFERQAGAPAQVRRLFPGQGGAVYAATAGEGLFRFRDEQWERWAFAAEEGADNVYAVLEEGDGSMLAGTSAGLYRVESGRLIEARPRVRRPVYFLARDHDGRLWIGTDNGVLRWDGASLVPLTVRDGLAGRDTNRAAGVVDSGGHVWIGTEHGLSVYRPEFERSAPVAPVVELLEAEASGRRHPLSGRVELSSRDREVLFRFRAVSFVDESRIAVRARLEGFDDDWLPARVMPRHEIRYTNLPPGDYRFAVQAAGAGGTWSEVVASQRITVPGPFWKRGWFGLLALALLAGAAMVVQHSVAQRRYARRLERDVADRLAEKSRIEAELARARRLESLGVLAGGIAHDFNNLMTAILGNLSLVKFDAGVQSDSRANLANAEAALLRARDLTKQLTTFSKGGAPVRKSAPIVEVVRESVSFVMSGAAVRWTVELSDDLWLVDIDAGQMSQVMGNLLINAVEAMPEGGNLTVTGRNLERPPPSMSAGRYVEIAIRDEGHGIPPEHLERIFDPYFSTKQRGSGLGLATAYSIVSRHEGLLTADSELGRGTSFHIFLPAAANQERPAPEVVPPTTAAAGRVLVMDDEPAVREIIGAVLSDEGYTVEYAEDGEQALERYRRAAENDRPFDVVILDLTVRGGMGGREALRRLLEIDPGVRAIVVSGYSNDPVMADCARYGFRGCVQKPFHPKELLRVVTEVAAGPRAAERQPRISE